MQSRHPVPRPVARARGYPFSLPGPAEREALSRASAYLRRAGIEVESRALLPTLPCGPPEADLRALRDSLRTAAALCDGMAELADGVSATHQSSQRAHPRWNREAPG